MIIKKPNLFPFTGGPGAGKTTLLEALAACGECCIAESARAVIREEIDRTGVRPIGQPFHALTLARDVAAFHAAGRARTFLDRSMVDSWAAAAADGPPWPPAQETIGRLRYNRRAFIFPPWKAIYVNDAERIQTWTEAIRVFELCGAAYQAAGYDLVELPLASVEERAAFVLDACA
jgi:predicted ATPase